MPGTVVVPLDGSPLAERALGYATPLARRTGARIVLVHARPALARAQEARFDPGPIAERLRAEGVAAEARVCLIYGDETSRAIRDAAIEAEAELIVMSTHGHGGLGRLLYGSVADAVLRESEGPVLLVPAACERAWPADLRLRILVPLDGLAPAEAILGPVGALARTLDAQLLLLRVVSEVSEAYQPDESSPIAQRPSLAFDAAHEYLQGVAEGLRFTVGAVEQLAVQGRPASAITRIAREHHVDLIGMTTHGRAGVARLVLGSTASGVLQHASVPLLLVRSGAAKRAAGPPVSTQAAAGQPAAGVEAAGSAVGD